MMTTAIHLLDDQGMGGVTRFLGHLLQQRTQDRLEQVSRRGLNARSYDSDLIVSHLAISWKSMPKFLALRACNPAARLVHVEHSYCRGFAEARVRNGGRFRALLIAAYALFDQVICVSQAQADWIVEAGLAPRSKVMMASPLTSLAPFEQIGLPEPSEQARVRYGFVGRLASQKGLDIALKAWSLVAPENATLEIFGDGPMRAELEAAYADNLTIRFHGATDTPAEAYRQIDIAILPSRWEPYGLSCLEARAAGRQVIVSAVDGLPEQIAFGSGRVVAPTIAGWVAAFSARLDRDALHKDALTVRKSAKKDANRAWQLWANALEVPRTEGDAFVASSSAPNTDFAQGCA